MISILESTKNRKNMLNTGVILAVKASTTCTCEVDRNERSYDATS